MSRSHRRLPKHLQSKKKRRRMPCRRLLLEPLEERSLLSATIYDLLDEVAYDQENASSFPAEFTELNGKVYFSAEDADLGSELWEGVEVGGEWSFSVIDINPTPGEGSHPTGFAVCNGVLYFNAQGSYADPQLWKYDGTAATQLSFFTSDPEERGPFELTEAGNELFFVADDGTLGEELWKYNAISGEVENVANLVSDLAGPDGSEPTELIEFDNDLYFSAYNDNGDPVLWQCNGITATQVTPGSTDHFDPVFLTVVDNNLYFTFHTPAAGYELWVHNSEQTALVADVLPGTDSGFPEVLTAFDGSLLFLAENADGGISPHKASGSGSSITVTKLYDLPETSDWRAAHMVATDDAAFFSIQPKTDESLGWQLWKTDGATTELVEHFTDFGNPIDPFSLTAVGDQVFFSNFDRKFGWELFVASDAADPDVVADIAYCVNSSIPSFLAEVGDGLFFAAADGVHGFEIYRSDGTADGTWMLEDLNKDGAVVASSEGMAANATLTAPEVAIELEFVSDTGMVDSDGNTYLQSPQFSVTANQPGVIGVDFDGDGSADLEQTLLTWGTAEFGSPSLLPEGTNTITAFFTPESDPATTVEDSISVVIDVTGPSLAEGQPILPVGERRQLTFSEPIDLTQLPDDAFVLDGPGLAAPVSLAATSIYTGTAPEDWSDLALDLPELTEAGCYSITLSPNLLDQAGNPLSLSSIVVDSFCVPVGAIQIVSNGLWDPSYENADLVVAGAELIIDGEHSVNSLTLVNGATVTHSAGSTLTLHVAGDVWVDDTSQINVDGKGYAGGDLREAGQGSGGGEGQYDAAGGSGGGHGGNGGAGGASGEVPGGTANDSDTEPVEAGSGGGGADDSTGGDGGGAVHLDVAGVVCLEGLISANGGTGDTGDNASGGAGGSVHLEAAELRGPGTIQANGGAASGTGGAGGGGRISVVADYTGWTGVTLAAAEGGMGSMPLRLGQPGTIALAASAASASAGHTIVFAPAEPASTQLLAATAPDTESRDITAASQGKSTKAGKRVKTTKTKRNRVTYKKLKAGRYAVNYKVEIEQRGKVKDNSPWAPASHFSMSFAQAADAGQLTSLSASSTVGDTRIDYAFFSYGCAPSGPYVAWDGGGGDGLWTTAANWSDDSVPGACANVVILEPNDSVIVTVDANTTVGSLCCQGELVVAPGVTLDLKEGNIVDLTMAAGAGLHVTGISNVFSTFAMASGTVLTVDGPVARFTAAEDPLEPTIVDGATLQATDGGTISLPGVTSYTNNHVGDHMLSATGQGSVLSLPNATTITGRSFANVDLFIQAFEGGHIDLPMVTEVPSGAMLFVANGDDSEIDVPLLNSFHGFFGYTDSGFEATNGGTIHCENLMSVTTGNITLDHTGVMDTSQMTSFADGTLTLCGSEPDFSHLAMINGASVVVEDGGKANLPAVTSYTNDLGADRVLRATGQGSVLSLPNATTITGRSFANVDLFIQAFEGGHIDLPMVTEVPSGAMLFVANGDDSEIDVPLLNSFHGFFGYTDSGFEATNGGTIHCENLMSVTTGNITLDHTGVMDTSQMTSFADGTLTLCGSEPDFSHLAMINGASVVVEDGGKANLPAVTSYTNDLGADRVLRATGQGSVLSLPNATTITGRSFANVDLFIQAFEGGHIDLPMVTEVPSGAMLFVANGDDSEIDVPLLNSFHGFFGYTDSGFEATNGGTIHCENLMSVTTGNITLDHTGVMDTSQMTSFADGTLTLCGSEPDFSHLAMINGASVVVEDGGKANLPAVTSYTNDLGADRVLRATGQGSVLSLPNATTITGRSFANVDLFIQAFEGGHIDLPMVTEVPSGAMLFVANGDDSEIDVPLLGSFQGFFGYTDSGFTATNGGTIYCGSLTTINTGNILLDETGQMWVATLDLASDSQLSGGGDLRGNLINRGTVTPTLISISGEQGLTIWGEYTQASNGILSISIAGAASENAYSKLTVTGHASFDGTLNAVLLSGYSPVVGESFGVVSVSSHSGAFAVEDLPPRFQSQWDLNTLVLQDLGDLDFGDAPDPVYATLLANDGARHVATGPTLATTRDAESDGQPNADADGDDSYDLDDEDGIQTIPLLKPGVLGALLTVVASEESYLNAWIDFNQDGTWDSSEQIAVDLQLGAGSNDLSIDVPVTAVPGPTYARLRLTSYHTGGTLEPTGLALDGEVEDYALVVDGELYLQGTSESDRIVVQAGLIGSSLHDVQINGNRITYDPALYDIIHINGLGGNDTITITGTSENDTVALEQGSADFVGQTYAVHATNVEHVTIHAGGGDDEVTMTGSTGSNRLYSYADSLRLLDSPRSFSFYADGFEDVSVNVPEGGRDYAFLYDSPGDDVLEADPSGVTLTRFDGTSDDTVTMASGFERVYVYATAGGDDTATLTGSDTAANRFYSYADYSMLTESRRSFYFYTRGFHTVTANSPAEGYTYAYLHDSPGVDTLTANPDSATMNRDQPWSDTTANGFARLYAYSSRGGDDSATLTGNPDGGNNLRAYPTYATLTDNARSFYHYARGFRTLSVQGASDEAGDRAYLYDSSGSDTLLASGESAILRDTAGTDYQIEALYFDLVYARSMDRIVNDTVDVDDDLAFNLIRWGIW